MDSSYKFTALTGKSITVQYSADGSSWHDTFTDGDLYMHTKTNGSSEWSKAMRIVGEKGDKGDTGATGTGISSVQELYYCTNSTSAPTISTSTSIKSTDVKNNWTTVMPTWATGYTYYTCSKVTFDDSSIKFTAVVKAEALTSANSTASSASTSAATAVSTANTASSGVAGLKVSLATTDENVAKAQAAADGRVKQIDVVYAYGSSTTEAPSEWQTTYALAKAQKSDTNKYLWTANKATFGNGDEEYQSATYIGEELGDVEASAVDTSNSYTDGQLEDYSTTDEINKTLEDYSTTEQSKALVSAYTPKYLGKYEEAPSDANNGDWYFDSDEFELKKYDSTSDTWTKIEYSTSNYKYFADASADLLPLAESDQTTNIGMFTVAYVGALFVNKIKVEGSIIGGDRYNSDGSDNDTDASGFYLGANGQLKCKDGQFSGTIKSENFNDVDTTGFDMYSYIKFQVKGAWTETASSIIEFDSGDCNSAEEALEILETKPSSIIAINYEQYIIKFYDNNDELLNSLILGTGVPECYVYVSAGNEDPSEEDYAVYDLEMFKSFTLPDFITYYFAGSTTVYKFTRFEGVNGFKLDSSGSADFYGRATFGENTIFKGNIESGPLKLLNTGSESEEITYQKGEYYPTRTASESGIAKGSYKGYSFNAFSIYWEPHQSLSRTVVYYLTLYYDGKTVFKENQTSTAYYFQFTSVFTYKYADSEKTFFLDPDLISSSEPATAGVVWYDKAAKDGILRIKL